MKFQKTIWLALVLAALTGCSAAGDSDSGAADSTGAQTATEATAAFQEEEEGETANAVYYQGQRYYGLVMYSTEIPEDLVLLGTAAQSSVSAINSRTYSGDTVPTQELQTNWTEPGVELYALYDENGEISSFWTAPGEVTGEAAYLGGVFQDTPPYYTVPEE